MSEEDDEPWVLEQRRRVIDYLARQEGLHHGEVGEWPAWHIAPIVAVWAIESLRAPGSVGWWAICGDLPTDYCSSDNCRHPRLALRRFAASWREAVAASDGQTLGSTGLPASLGDLLTSRAEALEDWAGDEDLWTET